MSKKGLFSSLIIALVVTLSLGIYTMVSVFGGEKYEPTNSIYSVAYRTGDTVDVLEGYSTSNKTLELTLADGETISPIAYNVETGKYEVVYAGEVTAVVKINKQGDKKTYLIKTYAQGTGESATDPYVLANLNHLKELATLVNGGEAEVPAYIKLMSDIDLAGEAWKPIGTEAHPYTGTFDGNGKTIKNLGISVDSTNYVDYVVSAEAGLDTVGFIDLGLFGRTNGATIKNVNLTNATISVNPNLYPILSAGVATESYANRISRLSVGALVASAYQTDIVGSEANSSVNSKIEAYAYANASDKVFAGVGGLVGDASLVRVSKYSVKANIVNNNETTKYSDIGGVVGSMTSAYLTNSANELIETPDASHKSSISNVTVDLTAKVLYSNGAYVGGIVGNGKNLSIKDSSVTNFAVTDETVSDDVVYGAEDVTLASGVATSLVTAIPETITDEVVINAFSSNVENVTVNGLTINMLGGDAAGAFGILGDDAGERSVSVKDVTVNGTLNANTVAGFALMVNSGATVEYTKVFENAVVDVDITAQMSAGFVFSNYGVISGYEASRTKIDVNTVGLGALITSTDRAEQVKQRNATYAAGFVVRTSLKAENVVPVIKNFEISFSAINSVNMAGVAITIGQAEISNVKVSSNITSYTYSNESTSFSTTYSVAGVACTAEAGANIDGVEVVINANKDVDTTKKYGASFFGGIVARYLGDNETLGLTINNCALSGLAYFNYTNELATFDGVTDGVFVAGGLVGAMEDGAKEDIDAFSAISIVNTSITQNNVSGLKITADFVTVRTGSQGWRIRAIGALIGVVNTSAADVSLFDLSSNQVGVVEIVANEETFSYAYFDQENNRTIEKYTLGAGQQNCYGSSYWFNIGYPEVAISNPTDLSKVTYTLI